MQISGRSRRIHATSLEISVGLWAFPRAIPRRGGRFTRIFRNFQKFGQSRPYLAQAGGYPVLLIAQDLRGALRIVGGSLVLYRALCFSGGASLNGGFPARSALRPCRNGTFWGSEFRPLGSPRRSAAGSEPRGVHRGKGWQGRNPMGGRTPRGRTPTSLFFTDTFTFTFPPSPQTNYEGEEPEY